MSKRVFVLLMAVILPLVAACHSFGEEAVSEERVKQPAILTQDEVTALNTMEQEWASHIDSAVPYIRSKDNPRARERLKKATAVIARMKKLLLKKGYVLDSIDRLVAMERLTQAYINMARIAGYIKDPRSFGKDFDKIRVLFNDTRQCLRQAEAKFHEVPPLQELCRQFLGILDEFEREVGVLIR